MLSSAPLRDLSLPVYSSQFEQRDAPRASARGPRPTGEQVIPHAVDRGHAGGGAAHPGVQVIAEHRFSDESNTPRTTPAGVNIPVEVSGGLQRPVVLVDEVPTEQIRQARAIAEAVAAIWRGLVSTSAKNTDRPRRVWNLVPTTASRQSHHRTRRTATRHGAPPRASSRRQVATGTRCGQRRIEDLLEGRLSSLCRGTRCVLL